MRSDGFSKPQAELGAYLQPVGLRDEGLALVWFGFKGTPMPNKGKINRRHAKIEEIRWRHFGKSSTGENGVSLANRDLPFDLLTF